MILYCFASFLLVAFLVSMLIWASLVVAKQHDIDRGLDYTQVLHTMD